MERRNQTANMTAIIPNLWSSNNSVPVTVEQALKAIQNTRRRRVLIIMDDVESSQPVGDLAEAIAAIELGKEITELDAQERKRVYVALYQVHLDTLDEVNAISYDDRAQKIHPTEATGPLADLVRYIESACEP